MSTRAKPRPRGNPDALAWTPIEKFFPQVAGLQPAEVLFSREPEGMMEFENVGEIIASRMLHLIDEHGNKRPVSVFVGKPQPSHSNPGYQCPFQIIGIGSQSTHVGHGRDSIQALKTALTLLGAKLHQLNEQLGGRLVWEGGAPGELGFP